MLRHREHKKRLHESVNMGEAMRWRIYTTSWWVPLCWLFTKVKQVLWMILHWWFDSNFTISIDLSFFWSYPALISIFFSVAAVRLIFSRTGSVALGNVSQSVSHLDADWNTSTYTDDIYGPRRMKPNHFSLSMSITWFIGKYPPNHSHMPATACLRCRLLACCYVEDSI